MKHLEIEMKTLLSEEEYDRLLAQFSEVTPITQKNYYLDTPDFYLRQHKIAIRIRTFENSAELTIKIPRTVVKQPKTTQPLGETPRFESSSKIIP